jgi:hypothetical protein
LTSPFATPCWRRGRDILPKEGWQAAGVEATISRAARGTRVAASGYFVHKQHAPSVFALQEIEVTKTITMTWSVMPRISAAGPV